MKLAKKILKKIKGKQKRNTSPTIESIAYDYYEGKFSREWRRQLFKRELEQKFGHHLTLTKRLSRLGHKAGKKQSLTPSMIGRIYERLGEP